LLTALEIAASIVDKLVIYMMNKSTSEALKQLIS